MIELAVALACAGCLAAVETFLIGVQAWEHRRFAASRLRSSPQVNAGTVGQAMVIVPCRGLEQDLEGNLERFFRQDYGDYVLRFVVESPDDPAAQVIRRLTEEHSHVRSELVVAGLADSEAQKIHNLRVATENIPPEVEYLVFADSDAVPTEHWLTAMVGRLRESRASAVTGYRWFVPERGKFHEAVVYALNGAYAMLMSRNTPNLIWGGSWAIRKKTFERLDIRTAWQGKICDDLVAAAQLLKNGLHVEYEPACLVTTACQPNIRSVFSFASRQFFLLRHVLPHWWLIDLAIGYFPTIVFWFALSMLLIFQDGLLRLVSATIIVVLYVLQWARAELRVAAVRTYFPDLASQSSFRRVFWFDRIFSPVIQFVGLLASLNGGLRRRIVWRGITYHIGRDGRIGVAHSGQPGHSSATAALECSRTDLADLEAKRPRNSEGEPSGTQEDKQHSVAA